jgi:hypothetical protein
LIRSYSAHIYIEDKRINLVSPFHNMVVHIGAFDWGPSKALSERLLSDRQAALHRRSGQEPILADSRRWGGMTHCDPTLPFQFAHANVGCRISNPT